MLSGLSDFMLIEMFRKHIESLREYMQDEMLLPVWNVCDD